MKQQRIHEIAERLNRPSLSLTEARRLGKELLDELVAARQALVATAMPLEVLSLAMQKHGPYREMTDKLQEDIKNACLIARDAISIDILES